MKTNITETLIIPESFADQRLDQALAQLLPAYSRTQIKNWLDDGSLLINGKTAKGKTKVKGNEAVTLNATLKAEEKWQPEAIALPIVFEDESFIIINKPVGLVVHPGAGNKNSTMLNAILHHVPESALLPRAGIIHRLDKDTSGLLVIAKTPEAFKSLTHQLKKREISREYQAIVYGAMISGGVVDAPIDRHPIERKRMSVSETGRHAVTHYRIAEKYRSHTRLAVKLETGRTHQIRVHMSHIHHPIVGDSIYGGRVKLAKGMSNELISLLRGFKRQALHACALGFHHPTTDEWVKFEAPLPDDMQTLIRALREDTKKGNEQ